MKVINEEISVQTKGYGDLVDITGSISDVLKSSGINRGILTVFTVGSTGAITTFEYEPGLIKDMNELYEKLVPVKDYYHHNATWGDGNGFSHVRAALQGPSLTVPFENGTLLLGTWQQVVVANFDNRSRQRKIVVNIIGE